MAFLLTAEYQCDLGVAGVFTLRILTTGLGFACGRSQKARPTPAAARLTSVATRRKVSMVDAWAGWMGGGLGLELGLFT